MAEDLMRYDLLAQDALRGVVRFALKRVEQDGLPGEHHFYIAFDTTAPGVRVSERVRQQYPQEMTIVLQHQYWGLEVTEDRFHVELSFDNIPEKLTIPFTAIKGFFDPSVQFGLQFEAGEANENAVLDDATGTVNDDDEPAVQAVGDVTEATELSEAPSADADAEPADTDAEPEKVVQLDAFRKK
jgi:hypothetical protein